MPTTAATTMVKGSTNTPIKNHKSSTRPLLLTEGALNHKAVRLRENWCWPIRKEAVSGKWGKWKLSKGTPITQVGHPKSSERPCFPKK